MILIALGANLPSPYGSPEEALLKAMQEIERQGLKIIATSRIWLTAPVPVSDQPDYRNAVLSVETSLNPAELLALLHRIEAEFGRTRHIRNEARILDLDLLAYDDYIIESALIHLPHPRMHDRAFVLGPLCDIAPQWMHPVLQKTAAKLLEELPDSYQASFIRGAA